MGIRQFDPFGRLLVRHVRDEAIRSARMLLDFGDGTPRGTRYRELPVSRKAAEALIADVVDETIMALLYAIDGPLHLKWVKSRRETIDLTEEGWGELAGEYIGDGNGWRFQFSKLKAYPVLPPDTVPPVPRRKASKPRRKR